MLVLSAPLKLVPVIASDDVRSSADLAAEKSQSFDLTGFFISLLADI